MIAGLLLTACAQDEIPEPITDEAPDAVVTDWISLFYGDDLNNFEQVGDGAWNIIDNYVESVDGQVGFLVTKDSYQDFDLHVEFWPSSDVNSGVFMRCENSTDIANEKCYELNIMDEHPRRYNATGAIINLAPPIVEIKTADQWNTFEISVRGDHIVIELNGTLVVDFRDQSFTAGPIGFQGKNGLIRFRNIQVRPHKSSVQIGADTVAAARMEGSVVCACPPVRSLGEFLNAKWATAFPGIRLERISAVGDWPARISVE